MSRLLRIILSVVVGLVLAFSAYLLGVTWGTGQTQNRDAAQSVYVVTGGVAAGVTLADAIDSGAVRAETYPAASLPADAVGPDTSLSKADVAVADLSPGQIVTSAQFVDKATYESGTGQLPGETLVSLELTVDGAVSGMLTPSDQVAVYASSPDGSGATLIVPRARVVLIGQSGADTTKTKDSGPVYVTLALTDAETQVVIGASTTSTIHLALLGK